MVDKRDAETIQLVKELLGRIGRTDAEVSRELVKRGGKGTPQAVGKWSKSGKIGRKNLDILRAMAEGRPVAAQQRLTKEDSAEDAAPELDVRRLRNSIHSIRLALGAMATVLARKRPNEGADVKQLFEDFVPPNFQDLGLGEHFLRALDDGLKAAAARPSSRRDKAS